MKSDHSILATEYHNSAPEALDFAMMLTHKEENEEEPTRSASAQSGGLNHGSLDHPLLKTRLSGKQRSYWTVNLKQNTNISHNTKNQKSIHDGLSDPSNTKELGIYLKQTNSR